MKLSRRRKVTIALTLAVVLLGAGLGITAVVQDDRVMRGVTVSGIPVQGLNSAELHERLRVAAQLANERPINLVVGEQRWTRIVSEFGLSVNLPSTVSLALRTGRKDPISWFRHTLGLANVDLKWVPSVDEKAFAAAVDSLAEDVMVEASNGEVLLEGPAVVAKPPSVGVALNKPRASILLIQSLTRTRKTIDLPVTTSQPDVGDDQVEKVRLEAEALLARDFTFSLPGSSQTATLSRDGLAKTLRTRVSDPSLGVPQLEMFIDPAALEEQLTSILPGVAVPPKDASFKVSGNSVSVVPSVSGSTINAEAAIASILSVGSQAERPPVLLSTVEKPASFTTEQAQALGIKERVSTFSTTFDPANAPRVKNIDLMAEAIDASVVLPGETFSLNATTGPRTPENGYQEAQIIVDGELVPGIGGGVCQVATTVFNAVYAAGLDIRERVNHSLYISRYPLGRDATVNYGLQDLKVRNDTPYGVLLSANVTRRGISVSIYSTPTKRLVETTNSERRNPKEPPVKYVDDPSLPQGQEIVDEEGSAGFDITVTRKVSENGQEIHADKFVSRYRAWKRIIRRGTGPPASPAPSPSTEQP